MIPSRSTRTVLSSVVIAAALSLALAWAQPMPVTFTGILSGDAVASGIETAASGEAFAVLIGNRLVVTGSYRDLSGDVTGANVRAGFPGEDGLPLRLQADQAFLNTGRFVSMWTSGGTNGSFSGVFDLTDEQVETLAAGGTYLQLYSETHPGGELRAQLETDLAVDPTPEDLVGIWRTVDGEDMWQSKQDGTWSYLVTLAEAGEASTWSWRFDGDIATWDLLTGGCEGRYVHREVLYLDGRRRWLVVEAGPCSSVGTWREVVKIDEQGNRIPLR